MSDTRSMRDRVDRATSISKVFTERVAYLNVATDRLREARAELEHAEAGYRHAWANVRDVKADLDQAWAGVEVDGPTWAAPRPPVDRE